MMSVSLLRRTFVSLALIALFAACGSPTPSLGPSESPAPNASNTTTTSVSPGVSAPIAAATVLAADPRFVGFLPFNPSASQQRWYELTANGAAWDVTVTVGWGDCSTTCPHLHNWHYQVGPDGKATLSDESGEGLPAGTFPSPANGVAQIHLLTTTPCPGSESCPVNGVPGAQFTLARFGANTASFKINIGANGDAHASLPGGVYILTPLSRPDAGALPAPFALSLAPAQDNLITVAFAASSATPAASGSTTP